MEIPPNQNDCISSRYHWKFKQLNNTNINYLEQFFLERSQMLYGKTELTDSESILSLLPPPAGFKDIEKAAERIYLAMQNQEKIFIFADYDVDGITSSALLRTFFREINYDIQVYIPDRMVEGYGLNPIGVGRIKELGGNLIITVDNGISATDGCLAAKKLGIDVIITDHHDLSPELPEAFAILNPKQPDCDFSFKLLAGVGVAFYLLTSLRSLLKSKNFLTQNINLRRYLDFVAIGTIADLAPLTGPNHVLCKEGLKVLNENLLNNSRVGINFLLSIAKWNFENDVDATCIGFQIAPRLNACGRLGNALLSEELLCTNCETRALELATILNSENQARQQLERSMTEEAYAEVEKKYSKQSAIVVYNEDWHPGVVGLVASRLLEKYYKPTLVLGSANGKIKGSGRSTHAFNLFSTLNSVREEFLAFGGHFHAVGLTMEKEKLNWLIDYLNESVEQKLSTMDFHKPLEIEGVLKIVDLQLNTLEKFKRFEPYGIKNPRPKWLLPEITIKDFNRIGKPGTNHAKVLLSDNSGIVWVTAFGMADELEVLFSNKSIASFVIEAKVAYWKGTKKPEIKILDFMNGGF